MTKAMVLVFIWGLIMESAMWLVNDQPHGWLHGHKVSLEDGLGVQVPKGQYRDHLVGQLTTQG